MVNTPSSPEMVPVFDFSTFTETLDRGWLSLLETTLPVIVMSSSPALEFELCAKV